MEWIPRNDISKLPTDDYCQVLVNLQTPTRIETTVMNYYPDEKDEEGNIGIEHSFSRNPPQSWDDNFTHYCIFPDPCVGKKDDTGTRQLTIPVVRKSFTPDFIVRELEDCDHLDDAIMRFKEQI